MTENQFENLRKKLGCSEKPPIETNFKVDDDVIYTNDYGIKFKRKILGFSVEVDRFGRFIYLCNRDGSTAGSAYWVPEKASSLSSNESDYDKWLDEISKFEDSSYFFDHLRHLCSTQSTHDPEVWLGGDYSCGAREKICNLFSHHQREWRQDYRALDLSWMNEERKSVFHFNEGDFTLVLCETQESFDACLARLDDFYKG